MPSTDSSGYGIIWTRAIESLRLNRDAENGVGAMVWDNGTEYEIYVYWISPELDDSVWIIIGNIYAAKAARSIDCRGLVKSASCAVRHMDYVGDREVSVALGSGKIINVGLPIKLIRSTQQVDSAEASTIAVPPSAPFGSPR